MTTCSNVFSSCLEKKQDFQFNNFINPVESYVGPSSYTTSYTSSDITDYPAAGNFGPFLNMKDPQITSSFSSFGPSSDGSENFGSTSYINYPPQTTTIFHDESPNSNAQQENQNTFFSQNQDISSHLANALKNQEASSHFANAFKNQEISSNFANALKTQNENSFNAAFFGNHASGIPPNFSSFLSSTLNNLSGVNLGPETSEVISEHVEVTKPVVVPVYKKFPYPQPKYFPVAIPHSVLGTFL